MSKPTDYKLFPESNIFINSSKVKSGIEFSLLSSEYWRQNKISKKKNIKNVLITFGGCDHFDLSSKFLNSLKKNIKKKLNIFVIIGQFYNNKKKINSLAKNTHHKVSLILKPLGLYKYLKKSDLIINAGGTTY